MAPSRIDEVRRQIEAAFAGVPYPGDDAIGEDPGDWETAELVEAFKGRHWRDLTRDALRQHHQPFLSAAGLQFYLPAYLLAALVPSGDLLLPFAVYALEPHDPVVEPDKVDLNAWSFRRWERLSQSQKDAVRAFLECVRDEVGDAGERAHAQAALDRYWSR